MSKTFDDLTNMVKKGVSVLARKTDEYAKIGKIKVEILSINRDLDTVNESLGKKVFQLVSEQNDTMVANNVEVKNYIAKAKELREKLAQKNQELESIKQEYAEKTGKPLDEKEIETTPGKEA